MATFSGRLVNALRKVLGPANATELVNKTGGDGSGEFSTLDVSGDISLTDADGNNFIPTAEVTWQLPDNVVNAFRIRIGSAGVQLFSITTLDDDESVIIGKNDGTGTIRVNSPLTTIYNIGTVAGTNITAVERGDGNIHKTVFTLTAHGIAIADAAAAGAHGSTEFYTFPEGHIRILGAHINLTSIATAGGQGIDDDAVLDIGVGQAAAGVDNDELTGTEADILHLDEVTLASGAATGNDLMGTTPIDIDGSATAGTLNLNVAVDADDVDDADTLTVTGTITIFWIHQGDD